jgi:6-phosphogluconolactonase
MQESNYRMASESLISHIRIPVANVHRVLTEHPPEEAARQYERLVRDWFGLIEGQLPRFDVMLLGLGNDGHTASLFPGSSALNEQTRLLTSVYVERLEQYRVTMTLPVLCSAGTVIFLVSGASKSKVLREVVEGSDAHYPAQQVIPHRGELLWYVDQAAASQLQHVSPI